MNRRDTIIIAVLLNAGLLIVLFATSLKSDKIEQEPPAITVIASNTPEAQEITPQAPLTALPAAAPSTDQVDQVIQQYITPQVRATPDSNPNFLADLQAIAAPSTPASGVNPTMEIASPVGEPVAAQTSFKEVKVKKGDVLERIARQNHVTVSEIMKANQLTSTRLRIGQVLKVPVKGASSSVSTVSTTGDQYYTVKAGDNPWTIAVKHHMKVEELLKMNNLDEQKAKRLKAGDKLRVK